MRGWLEPMEAPLPIKPQPRRRCGRMFLAMAVLAACSQPLAAWGAERGPVAKRLLVQPQTTPEAAASIARRETGGRVLSITALTGDQRGYRVRLLLDGGRVTAVLVDGQGRVHRSR